MKLFHLGGRGRLIPVTVSTERPDLSVYVTLSSTDRLSVTVINKSHGSHAKDASLELKLASPWQASDARAISLSAIDGDIAATSGITLGGEPIRPDGGWSGQWTPLKIPVSGNVITLNVPSASAMVISAKLKSVQ